MPQSALEKVRPGYVCQALLAALDASEGRRRRRKRDQTPDAIGLAIKRRLLEQAVREEHVPFLKNGAWRRRWSILEIGSSKARRPTTVSVIRHDNSTHPPPPG
jgi:hypothetical protein